MIYFDSIHEDNTGFIVICLYFKFTFILGKFTKSFRLIFFQFQNKFEVDKMEAVRIRNTY